MLMATALLARPVPAQENIPRIKEAETKGEKPAMLPQKPEDWPRVFEQHFNVSDLDAVMALYEPEAHFVAKSGEILVGRDQIRKVLGGMIEAKTRLHSRVVRRSELAISLSCIQTSKARRSILQEKRLLFAIGQSKSCADSRTATGNLSSTIPADAINYRLIGSSG
jgi:hypothetical protein